MTTATMYLTDVLATAFAHLQARAEDAESRAEMAAIYGSAVIPWPGYTAETLSIDTGMPLALCVEAFSALVDSGEVVLASVTSYTDGAGVPQTFRFYQPAE